MASLDDYLAEARSGLTRVEPSELADAFALGALVVDIRDSRDRLIEGTIPGSAYIPRSVLEWRVVPSSPHRSHDLTADSVVILVCNDGYSSSPAAATLQTLGLAAATDLVGGYRAWRRYAEASGAGFDRPESWSAAVSTTTPIEPRINPA